MKITGGSRNLWRKYLHFDSVMGSFFVFALATLTQLAAGRTRVASQRQESHPETWAWMEIELNAPGRSEVRIYLHPTPHDSTAVISEIKQALGCESLESALSPEADEEEEESMLASESEQRWSRDLWCNGTMLRQGLAAGGVFDPAPLLLEARSRGLRALEVTIENYGPWTSSLQAPPSWAEGSVDNKFLVPVDASPGLTIRLRFGYSWHDLAGIILPALTLLLLPLPVTLWIRHVLVREADTVRPQHAPFGYWRFLQWNMLGAFLLWLIAVGFLKLGPFLRFILDISSPNRTTALEAASYASLMFLPPMIVNLICTILYYPVFSLHGVQWSKHQVLEQAIWTQVARLVPLALIVAAFIVLSSLNMTLVALILSAALFARILGARRLHTVTIHIVPSALTLATFIALFSELPGLDLEFLELAPALLAAVVVILLARILGLRRLLTVHREPRTLRSGELRDRAFALAKQARAKLKEFYVLPTTTAPTANVCFRRGNAIVLTDYLVEHFSRREVDAVLAHELAHLKRRHPILLPLPFLVAVGLGSLGLELGWHVRGLSDTTLLLICLLVGMAFSLLLMRHFARAADAAAADLTKDPESLISALVKLSTLNRMPLLSGILQNPLITHLSILNCAQRVARSTGIAADRLTRALNSPETPSDRYALPTRH
jgi:Zn-dependent protease with chaperone function